jgi:MFS family permease
LNPAVATPLKARAVQARIAISAVFLLNGFAVASWAVRIPAVREALRLSDGTLGLVLLSTALGSLVAMPIVGRLCTLYGSGRVTFALSVLFALALPLPALAGGLIPLALALFLYGATNGGLDVAMNTQATGIELRYQRPILSSFHALWSVGSLLGAAAGGLIARNNISPGAHLLAVAALIAVGFIIASRFTLPDPQHAEENSTSGKLLLSAFLLALGAVAFCALLAEGAIADWSALYLRDEFRADEGLAAAGFVAFQITMAAFRFAGDGLRARLGDSRVVLMSGVVAAAGLAFGLIVHQLWAGVLGFALVGAGVAVVFPAALGLVSKMGSAAGPAIAWVSAVGYAGFLVGPPLIGLLSEATSLRFGLAAVVVMCAMIAVLSSLVRTKD